MTEDYIVRRLTPVEAERLQGLHDNWTDIEFKGKPAPDTKRYKAIGNGMAHPCAVYVLQQICKAMDVPLPDAGGVRMTDGSGSYDVYSMGHDERSAGLTPNITDPLTASDFEQPAIVAMKGKKV